MKFWRKPKGFFAAIASGKIACERQSGMACENFSLLGILARYLVSLSPAFLERKQAYCAFVSFNRFYLHRWQERFTTEEICKSSFHSIL